MITKKKSAPVIEPQKQAPAVAPAADNSEKMLAALAEQNSQLASVIAEAANQLALVIAKNKPADGYLFTVQRDGRGQITGLVAKRGRNSAQG
jgi:hypothetical protein